MNIILIRHSKHGEAVDGKVMIEGEYICQTAENYNRRLPAGKYEIRNVKCRQHSRKMLMLFASPMEKNAIACFKNSHCSYCKKRWFVSGNAVMPHYCPMFTTGNGIHGRDDGSIIVGNTICPGCVKDSLPTFKHLYERVRKALNRGKTVTVEIHEYF